MSDLPNWGDGSSWQPPLPIGPDIIVQPADPAIVGAIVSPKGNFDWIAKLFGLQHWELTNIIHDCKRGVGAGALDDIGIDTETGDIIDMRNGEIIGDVFGGW